MAKPMGMEDEHRAERVEATDITARTAEVEEGGITTAATGLPTSMTANTNGSKGVEESEHWSGAANHDSTSQVVTQTSEASV